MARTDSKMASTDLAAEARKAGAKAKRSQPFLLKTYLLGYNIVSCGLWALVLVRTLEFLVSHSAADLATSRVLPTTASAQLRSLFSLGASKLGAITHAPKAVQPGGLPWPVQKAWAHMAGSYDYKGLGPLVVLTQTGALLEVVHALLGWVRSDPTTVAMQVASRIWMVWGVVEQNHETHYNPLFTSMILAWSITEVIRYSFYAFALVGMEPKILSWLRYNTFYLLYPLGAGSEAFLMASTLPPLSTLGPSLGAHLRRRKGLLGGMKLPAKGAWGARDLAVGGLFVIWWPALYVLFTHMTRIRRKVMSKGRTLQAKKQQ